YFTASLVEIVNFGAIFVSLLRNWCENNFYIKCFIIFTVLNKVNLKSPTFFYLMKIAIVGARGIPNFYGGFEQFAEYLSLGLVQKGHDVTVYNSHTHPYQEPTWNGVKIIHCKDPEDKIGTAGQFIYDLNCIRDARKRDYDIILQLGYTSSSIWGWLMPRRKSIVTTNMDGLEWKRTKYSKKVQKFLLFAE